MRKIVIGVAGVVAGIVGLYWLAGRSTGELTGLVRASADKTVDDLHDQIPAEIHDRKLDHDLALVRQEVVDRQIQLTLSKNQLDALREDDRKLTGSTERRQRLLAEAYPILETATKENKQKVKFANQEFSIGDFQREIDSLLTAQDREERQLAIKRNGLERLEKGAREGEEAIQEMRGALDKSEQEVAILRSRREQAEIESKTLDMVASVTSRSNDTASSVGKSVEGLKTGVEKLEARNDARRAHGPNPTEANRLSKGWTRLESLKAIADKVNQE